MVWAMLDRGTTVAGKMDGQDLPCQFLEIEKDGPKFGKKSHGCIHLCVKFLSPGN